MLTPQTVAAQTSLRAAKAGDWPGEGWWSDLGDPQLASLITEGLKGSPDVAAAAARMRQAAALTEVVGASRLPSLDVQAALTANKQSYNNGFPKQFTAQLPQGFRDNARVSTDLAYDLDLWGKHRAALAAATSQMRAAAIDAAQARLMLATDIANAYSELAYRFDERDIREAALKVRLSSARLVAAREAQGLENRGSLRQAEALVAGARADLAAADELIVLLQHQIAALIGAGPDRGLAITRPALGTVGPIGAPADASADLIGRRPDIAAARERAEAAAQRIKAARADFYPAIRLSAMAGLQAVGIGNLLQSDSVFASAGPAISLPLFDGGARRGRYRGAEAVYDEAVDNYNKAVVSAYQQVADALSAQATVAQRRSETRAALAASEEAYAIARRRYDGGLSTYLDVLTVEDRLLQVRSAAAGLEALTGRVNIALIRALGGGYQPAPAMTTKEIPHD